MNFSKEQKQELLAYARKVIEAIVKDGIKYEDECPDSNYLEPAGVFVTLHKNAELRGCIGYIEPVAPIWDAIADNAIAAATKDLRFSPVTPEELPEVKIEISILTTPKSCHFNDIEIGKDGVIIQQGWHKATYLPQVWKSIPEKEKFLDSLCEKAGLAPDCWQSRDTKISKYQVICFSE